MKIYITCSELLHDLSVMKPLATKGKLLLYSTVWFTAGRGGFDLEMSSASGVYLRRHVPARVEDFEEGCIGVNFGQLYRLLRHAPEDICLEFQPGGYEGQRLKIVFASGWVSCDLVDPCWKDHPPAYIAGASVNTEFLADALARTWRFTFTGDYVESISCVRLRADEQGRLLAEALNGHEYRCVTEAVESGETGLWADVLPEQGVLLPRKPAKELAPLLRSGFLGGSVLACVRSDIDGYPGLHLHGDRGDVIAPSCGLEWPTTVEFVGKARAGASSLSVPADELCGALRILQHLTDADKRAVFIAATPKGAAFSVDPAGEKDSFILSAPLEGPVSKIAFPARDLLAQLKEYKPSETVRLTISSQEGPCLITGAEHVGLETIIMPMKIAEDFGGADADGEAI